MFVTFAPHIYKELVLLKPIRCLGDGGELGNWAFFTHSLPLYHHLLPQRQQCMFEQTQQSAQKHVRWLGFEPGTDACPWDWCSPLIQNYRHNIKKY